MLAVLAAGAARLWASDAVLPSMDTPSGLSPLTLELRFLHRFQGDMLDRPLETVLGATQGANAGFGLRFSILQGLEVQATGATGDREMSGGMSYTLGLSDLGVPLSVQAEALGFYEPTGGGLFASVSTQTEPLLGVFSPALSVSFDTLHLHLGWGVGLVVDLGSVFSLFGEVYPFTPFGFTKTEGMGSVTAFSAGFKLRTFGHQFMILVSNTDSIGERRLAAGAIPGSLHLGFNILRRFWF